MRRFLLTALVALIATTTAQAGPIRDRIAARFARPCQPCQAVQVQPTPTVQYQPAPVPAYTQPVQAVAAYQPAGFGPVRTCSGGVCK